MCLLSVLSCEKSVETSDLLYDADQRVIEVVSRPNHVSQNAVAKFLGIASSRTKSTGDVYSIEPYVIESDTVMYIVNYASGWKILSADKRTPVTIAESETGRLSLGENSSRPSWIRAMAYDMRRVSLSTDDELSFTQDEIVSSLDMWESMLLGKDLPPFTPEDSLPRPMFGHWELYFEGYETEIVSFINHQTDTQWDQGYPYDVYCPLNSDESGHKPVGCAAVAAGQMLYYLHDYFGEPAFSNGGIILDSLSTTYSSTLNAATDSTAKFLAEIGSDMNMHYHNEYSWTTPSNVVDFFADYGYSCSYESFDDDIVEASLWDGMPVIVLAMDDFIGIPDISVAHYFLIDGCRKMRQNYVKKYQFVYDGDDPMPSQLEVDRVEIINSTPYISFVKMNWGWRTQWDTNYQLNDGWYALTGSWTTYDSQGHSIDYDCERHMISGFTLE